jgi:hypothetical protein
MRGHGYCGTYLVLRFEIITHTPQAFLFDHDSRFWDGWHLDVSWSLCTTSWTVLLLTALAIAASAIYLPSEGDYDLILDQTQVEPDDQ